MRATEFYTEIEAGDPYTPDIVGRRNCLICGADIRGGYWGVHARYHGISEED